MKEKKTELRFLNNTLEIRAEGTAQKIAGYIAVFDSFSEDLGWYKEKIERGAFKKTISERDIVALKNHDSNYVLGRKSSGSLVLREDDRGLFAEITPPNTQWANDLIESIRRGDTTGASFGFQVINAEWETKDGKDVRILKEVKLIEVSVGVTFPAYADTSIGIRSLFEEKGLDREKIRAIFNKIDLGDRLNVEEREILSKISNAIAEYLPSGASVRAEPLNTPFEPQAKDTNNLEIAKRRLELYKRK